MKVVESSNQNSIIYLPNIHIDFENMKIVEEELRKIFKRLKYYYSIAIQGFYEVKAYKNKYYGLILELTREDLGYFDYDDGEIDMRIEIMDVDFVYEIRDVLELPKEILEKCSVYLYQNHFYLTIKEELSLPKLMEQVLSISYRPNPFLLKEKNKIVG